MRQLAHSLMKRSVRALLHDAGALRPIRWRNRSKLRILTYHRFLHQPGLDLVFESHCKHLRQYYSPVTLTDAARWLCNGDPLPPNAVVVTVDDGYRDFLTMAMPSLKRYGIPATVYLIGNFPDRSEWMWWDKVRYAVFATRYESFTFAPAGGQSSAFRLGSAEEREAAAASICETLKRMPDRVMRDIAANLSRDLGVELPCILPEYYLPMTWDECRMLAGSGVEFGSHTLTHPILPMLNTQAEVDAEILGSRVFIEERLQQPVRHFCYPNGDLDDRSEKTVRGGGFASAVTVQAGLVDRSADPFRLARLSVDLTVPQFYFAEAVAGF